MWGAAQGDVDAGMAMQWLLRTRALERYAAQAALPSPIAFVDVETTRDRVVEIAVVRLQHGWPPAVFHTYVDPGADTAHRTPRYWNTAIHGLTPRIVLGRPTFDAISPSVDRLLSDATVCAHNVAFERRFLGEELARTGRSHHRPDLCTLALARRLYPERRADGDPYTLDAMASLLDVRSPAPHRAIGDAFTTLWVLLAMLERNAVGARAPSVPGSADAIRACTHVPAGARGENPWTRSLD